MPTFVADLVDMEGKWKREVIELCFSADEASAILCMPISRFGCPDRMVWHYTRNGVYLVKSGYMVAQEMNKNGELGRKGVGQSSMDANRDVVWRDIWRLTVPPKFCHFIWKGCKNVLAIRRNLQKRGIRLDSTCPFCDNEVETQVHIFFHCPFARAFWFGSPLQLDVTQVVGGDFLECWKWLYAKYSKEGEASDLLRWVVGGLWRLWKCRNSLVFEKAAIDPLAAIQLLQNQWEEWRLGDEAHVPSWSRGKLGKVPVPQVWIKPPFGTLKVNCDGAWCSRTSIGGVGWVVRDFAGIFKGAGGIGNLHCVSSIMAEAEALRVALTACVAKGFTSIQVETDSQVLVDMIHGRLQREVVLDGILWDISMLKQHCVAIEFLYAPRVCNKAGHMVASYAMRMGVVIPGMVWNQSGCSILWLLM